MLCNFDEVIKEVKKLERVTISVAAAHDRETLLCVKNAIEQGLADCVLIGNKNLIKPLADEIGIPTNVRIIHEENDYQAAVKAVSVVRTNEAQLLLKGLLNTSDYLKAVLNSDTGLRTGRLLSHLAAYEVPGGSKLLYATDTGINIIPDLEQKKQILSNALEALNLLGIEKPKVAIITPNELVNSKIQSTIDAKVLADLYENDKSFLGIVEGPIAMDVAISPESAKHKAIKSRVSGNVDLYLMPSIDAGNMWSKALIYYANFKMAGLILGVSHPVVLVSRSDNAETKLNSIALACLLAAQMTKKRNELKQ